jgi:hypothetical protein
MFGMILDTGLVFSRWWMALIAIFFFPDRQPDPHSRRGKTPPRILRRKIRRLRPSRPSLLPPPLGPAAYQILCGSRVLCGECSLFTPCKIFHNIFLFDWTDRL